jgi:hypothetical protein
LGKTVAHKFKLTAVALANKVARIVFALLTRAAAPGSGLNDSSAINGVSLRSRATKE